MHVEIDDMPNGYRSVIEAVLRNGVWHESRNGRALEVVGATVEVNHPWICGVSGIGRAANSDIGIIEALQLIAGEATPELMSQITGRKFDRYRDGEVLHGAYGPRLRAQMPYVVDQLSTDSETRQAVAQIWDPAYDQQDRADLPCTTGFQFLLRDDRLHMITTMRSNDMWWGFPYDIFQFSQLQHTVANVLSVGVGPIHHRVGSLHLYGKDIEAASKVSYRVPLSTDCWYGVTADLFDWDYARRAAKFALSGKALTEDRLILAGAEIVMKAHGVS